MNNDNYKYEFKYTCDDIEVTMKMSAEKDSTTLANRLGEFLLACSWRPEAVAEIVNFEGSENYKDDNDD